VILGATAIGFAGAMPLFWLMYHPDSGLIFLGQMGFVVAVGMFLGAQPALMVESTPAAVRCTAIALGYNVTLGIIGGMTPLAATWLVYRTHNDLSPALLDMAAAAISFLTVLRFGETSGMPPEIA
jgi:MFS transporter, MHS family, proline/betaine transporter